MNDDNGRRIPLEVCRIKKWFESRLEEFGIWDK